MDFMDITPAELEGSVIAKLYQDETAENPRTSFDHAGTLYCDTRDFDLSDKDASLPAHANAYGRWSDIEISARWIELHGGVAVPVRCDDYGSSGARAYTSDAENANGLIWIEAEKIESEWTAHGTPDPKEAALRCLNAEIEELDQYLQGDVYGYVIETPDGDHLDSCWGFYGQKYATEEAEQAARYAANAEKTERCWAARNEIATVA